MLFFLQVSVANLAWATSALAKVSLIQMIWEVSQLIEKDATIDIADGNNNGDNNDDINIDFAFLLSYRLAKAR